MASTKQTKHYLNYIIVLIILIFVGGLFFVKLSEYRLELSITAVKGYLSDLKLTLDEEFPNVQNNLHGLFLSQNQSKITKMIHEHGSLHPPAPTDARYNLRTLPGLDPSMGQSGVVKSILNYTRNGFFIECGALDGETRSNTLALERDYGWKGLLIEGDPSNFKIMQKKHRKAWTANCCLSIHPFPHTAMYQQNFNTGQILPSNSKSLKTATEKGNLVSVQCFPLFSLLSALNVTRVDYFSLDVEGHELKILQTIPFDLIQIKVLSVEFIHGKGGADPLEAFMVSKGYRVITRVIERSWLAHDLIFVHQSIPVTRSFPKEIIVRGSKLFEKDTWLGK